MAENTMAETDGHEKRMPQAFLNQIGDRHNFREPEQAEHSGHDGVWRPANGGAVQPQLYVSALLSFGTLALSNYIIAQKKFRGEETVSSRASWRESLT